MTQPRYKVPGDLLVENGIMLPQPLGEAFLLTVIQSWTWGSQIADKKFKKGLRIMDQENYYNMVEHDIIKHKVVINIK